jgi:magnesium chelatase family protein
VTAIHSIAGTLPAEPRLIRRAPFQAPHHTASAAALVGGGSGLARPGALSLAHHGVLFLDEAPLFGPRVLDGLRQPLEERWVTLVRAHGVTCFPAAVQLVLAANPCPCGAQVGAGCDCSSLVRRRYRARLSGPLLDRIDIQVTLQPLGAGALLDTTSTVESSAVVLARVVTARAASASRWRALGYETNAQVPGQALRSARFRPPNRATAGLVRMLETGALSARGFDRVLRVAWTIVDTDGRSSPTSDDVMEAAQLRLGEAL